MAEKLDDPIHWRPHTLDIQSYLGFAKMDKRGYRSKRSHAARSN